MRFLGLAALGPLGLLHLRLFHLALVTRICRCRCFDLRGRTAVDFLSRPLLAFGGLDSGFRTLLGQLLLQLGIDVRVIGLIDWLAVS